jgi:predicted O-methyltransferase YrrM
VVPGAKQWDAADFEALEILRPLLDGGYLPWTEGALRPAALAVVCNEIALADRREIVELGAGVSTIVLARLVRERGGRLTSLEHDEEWARVVRSQLEREELTEVATLLEAPLEPHALALDGAPWYAAASVERIPHEIDLLLIDGPPAYGEGMARSRYPALPALADRLSERAIVVLDDALRPGEREVIDRWAEWQESETVRWSFAVREAEGIATSVRVVF